MIIAIDVGATKTLIGQFTDDGVLLPTVRFSTPPLVDDFMHELHQKIAGFAPPTAIAIGVPGVVSDDGSTLIHCGNLSWRNVPLKDLLAKAYNCPVYMENDANVAALSEINALSPVPRLGVYITVSTGIGTGMVASGELVPELLHAEAGAMRLRTDKGWEKWEAFASGQAIKKHFGKLTKDLHTPEELAWIADRLSTGLVAFIPLIRPGVIVFGGGVGKHLERFAAPLQKELQDRLPGVDYLPILKSAKHAEEAVLYGCYYYATHQATR